ncbi:NUDIX hydrolase [Neobacillus endophyticus]|uniref:NUDIX hydrolase n=1 Tax=Neobacillus endophyticus TaxID=2738405 RepID=UPI001C2577C3|nr:NUDIX domain-containing protein [Neobacillus endophyticus]
MNSIVVVVKGLILHNGKVLIVKRAAEDEVGGGTWECAGGKIEFGEELEAALRREIKEEVGLDVTFDRILYATTFNTHPSRQVVILTYLCHGDHQEVSLSKEHSAYKWTTKDQLRYLLSPGIVSDFEKNKVFDLPELV